MATSQLDVNLLKEYKQHCSWVASYGMVKEIARSISASNILEIGVAYGYHAAHLLEGSEGLTYVGIDPYKAGYDPSDSFSNDVAKLFGFDPLREDSQQLGMDKLFLAVTESLRQVSPHATIERMNFLQYSKKQPTRTFDLIYVDGDHTEAGAFTDIIFSLRHVSHDGVICGDDIEWQGVQQALERASKLYRLEPKILRSNQTGKLLWYLEGAGRI